MKIITNSIRCKTCGQQVTSRRRHEYAPCGCGACAADGGEDYLRRTFQRHDCFTECSEVLAEPQDKEALLRKLEQEDVIVSYAIANEALTVRISTLGAELRSILGTDGTEYLWQGDPAVWSDRAPNLFPFVGRLPNKKYRIDGEEYTMGIHGFAASSLFAPVLLEPDRIVLEMTDSPETLAQYPRCFSFRVEYALVGNVLETTFYVENRDEKIMHFGIGGHPGIRLPLEDGLCFEQYKLTFPEAENATQILFSQRCLVNGEAPYDLTDGIALRHELFDDDAIVLRGAGHTVTLSAPEGKHAVTVRYPGMEYIGFWQADRVQAAYLCIEPWCSLPAFDDAETLFEQHPDLIHLEPGNVYKNTWTMEIR